MEVMHIEDQAQQRPPGRPSNETVYNNETDIHGLERPSGTSRAQALRRLRAQRPDLAARVCA
jgi:hypothetical protein